MGAPVRLGHRAVLAPERSGRAGAGARQPRSLPRARARAPGRRRASRSGAAVFRVVGTDALDDALAEHHPDHVARHVARRTGRYACSRSTPTRVAGLRRGDARLAGRGGRRARRGRTAPVRDPRIRVILPITNAGRSGAARALEARRATSTRKLREALRGHARDDVRRPRRRPRGAAGGVSTPALRVRRRRDRADRSWSTPSSSTASGEVGGGGGCLSIPGPFHPTPRFANDHLPRTGSGRRAARDDRRGAPRADLPARDRPPRPARSSSTASTTTGAARSSQSCAGSSWGWWSPGPASGRHGRWRRARLSCADDGAGRVPRQRPLVGARPRRDRRGACSSLVLVITNPPEEAGRGAALTPTAVATAAEARRGATYLQADPVCSTVPARRPWPRRRRT